MSIRTIAATLAAASLVFAATASAEVLRIGSETTYPPFEFQDPGSAKYIGFDIDLIDELARRAKFTPQIRSMGLDALVPAIMSGNIDVAVSALSITPERKKNVDFTKPYYKAELKVMTHKDFAKKIKSAKDLEGAKMCAEIGSSGAMQSRRIKGTTVRDFNSASEAFMELSKKGCLAMINDSPVNEYFLTQKASQGMNLVELDITFSEDEYGIALKKGNKKLANRLNKALEAMRADGSYNRIHRKWFGVDAK